MAVKTVPWLPYKKILRENHGDSQAHVSHRFGTSVSNQRIECWWSHFRRGPVSFIIQLFKDLVDAGHLDLHNQIDIGCCRFAFMVFIQHHLDVARTYWNTHYIRCSRQQPSRPGIPDELFFLPNNMGVRDFGKVVDARSLAACHQFVNPPSTTSGTESLDEYLTMVMRQLNLKTSTEWQECVRLYLRLKDAARNGT